MQSVAQRLAKLTPEDRAEALSGLTEAQALDVLYDWRGFNARPDQIAPLGDWDIWLALAGRGWGKTKTGSEWVREEVDAGRAKRIALIAETAADGRDVIVEGDSGIMAAYPEGQRPLYEPSKRRVTWANGAVATLFNATEPDQLRGPQFDLAWCFIAGTSVAVQGGAVSIETIAPGGLVLTRDGLRRVAFTSSKRADVGRVVFSNGAELVGTADHPVLCGHNWTRLADLRCGDVVFGETAAVSVVSTWVPAGVDTVYNLQVEGLPEYFANGILVHNCDELAKWKRARETWDMLQFGLRLGKKPRVLVTTTPRPIELVKAIVAGSEGKVVLTRGHTMDNRANLAQSFLEKITSRHANTRLGRQELAGEILGDIPNALWTYAMIDASRVKEVPANLGRVVIAVDPAVTNTENSDDHGIIAAGASQDMRDAYVLEDGSCKGSPMDWARRAVAMFDSWQADAIVVEVNQGGDMVAQTIRSVRSNIPIREVRASRGKHVRAEPVSSMYQQGRVHHVGGFPDLEQQMTMMTSAGYEGEGSPDRLDAAVWAMTDLIPQMTRRIDPKPVVVIPTVRPMARR